MHSSAVEGTGGSHKFKNSLQASMPSLWEMLVHVYSEVTSSVAKRVPDGSVGNLLSLLMRSVVSLMYDKRVETQLHVLDVLCMKESKGRSADFGGTYIQLG